MHKVKTQRFGELFVKNMLIIYFYMFIIKTYKVKKNLKQISRNFRKDWNKSPPWKISKKLNPTGNGE